MLQIKNNSIILGKVLFVFVIFTYTTIPLSYAQSIPITISGAMDDVIFDGKWTFWREWKESSLTNIETESGFIYIRTAHWKNFIYVMIDAVADTTINNNKDESIICFDTKDEINESTDNINYCFSIKLGSQSVTQRRSILEQFEIVENHADLIAIGNSSDENDRYSKTPHVSYEFRIPLELLHRSDKYGFYVEIFDFAKSKTYIWPSGMNLDSKSNIPPTEEWGLIYSPDKSLPEYELPILVLVLAIVVTMFISLRKDKLGLRYYKR